MTPRTFDHARFTRRIVFTDRVLRRAVYLTLICTLAIASARLGAPQFALAQQAPFDTVIRGGRLLDGTGAPWIRADIAIRGDRIAAIGRLDGVPTRRTIDARNRIVAPGFIDMHSHSDFTLLVDGHAQSKIRQGVTTEVIGETESVGPMIGLAVDVRKNALTPLGLKLDWQDFAGYFSRLEKQGISVNVLSFVGAGQLRTAVVGLENRPPSSAEIERMKALAREAMAQGAFGLSSGLIYPPNSYMTIDELVELARIAGQEGGIYISHLRDEGAGLVKAVREAITIGERAGLPVGIFHFKAVGSMRGKILEAIRVIEEAQWRGIEVAANQYPYVASSTNLAARGIPPWVQEGGRQKMIERLKDPKVRERIRAEMASGLPGWESINDLGGFENIRVSRVRSERNKKYEGQSIAAIAKDRGVAPEDTLMDLLVEEEGNVSAIYFIMTEEDIKAAMKLPWVSIGSDGTAVRPEGVLGQGRPHPRWYGTFPRVLGKYVREEKVLTLEEAIRKMTSLPAAQLRLGDRGLLKVGMAADVVVFDPDRVTDRATFEDPHRYAEGIDIVIVNGERVIDEGRHTGATPGRVLRGPGYRSPARASR
jgi:N-acyl-D-aspartate/D-glutamate deacylase